MIDEQTTASTAEICLLAGFTKQRLGKLESQGIVTRRGRDQWPLAATMRALLADARVRSEAHSATRAKLDELRAQREQLRIQRESHDLVRLADFTAAITAVAGAVLKHLSPLSAQIAGRDVALGRRVDDHVRRAQQGISDDLGALADQMEQTGRPA